MQKLNSNVLPLDAINSLKANSLELSALLREITAAKKRCFLRKAALKSPITITSLCYDKKWSIC